MDTPEPTQVLAVTLPVSDAEALLSRVRNCRTFITYGIEVYTVSAEPMVMYNGETRDAVNVMVRAETDMQAGIGKGYLIAHARGT